MSATPGFGLDGQVAVITGAASGFGLAVATRLAAELRIPAVSQVTSTMKSTSSALHAHSSSRGNSTST